MKGLGCPRYRGGTVFGFKPPGFKETLLVGHQIHPGERHTPHHSYTGSQHPLSHNPLREEAYRRRIKVSGRKKEKGDTAANYSSSWSRPLTVCQVS